MHMIAALAASAGLLLTPHAGHVDWQAKTCAAAAAYGRHPTQAGLATVVTDATHLGKSWLAADAGVLFADASSPSPNASKYVRKDVGYVLSDCKM